jgi:hypothetical protein
MEDLSTEQHAVLISDSITNGQRKQAIAQFMQALADGVNAFSLCVDISGEGVEAEKIIKILCEIIENQ